MQHVSNKHFYYRNQGYNYTTQLINSHVAFFSFSFYRKTHSIPPHPFLLLYIPIDYCFSSIYISTAILNMSSSNQGNDKSGQTYTGLEADHGDTKNQQAAQSAQAGMTSGAVSADHTKSGGSSGDMGDTGKETTSRQLHS